MSFDWKNYLHLAEHLPATTCRGGVEARLRTSISRAYYAVFCQARNNLLSEGKSLSGMDQHQSVIAMLHESGDGLKRKIATELGRLRRNRNKADYDDDIDNVAFMQQVSMTWAASIQKDLQQAWK